MYKSSSIEFIDRWRWCCVCAFEYERTILVDIFVGIFFSTIEIHHTPHKFANLLLKCACVLFGVTTVCLNSNCLFIYSSVSTAFDSAMLLLFQKLVVRVTVLLSQSHRTYGSVFNFYLNKYISTTFEWFWVVRKSEIRRFEIEKVKVSLLLPNERRTHIGRMKLLLLMWILFSMRKSRPTRLKGNSSTFKSVPICVCLSTIIYSTGA